MSSDTSFTLLVKFKSTIFFFNTANALGSFSTKTTFFTFLDKHYIPKEPTPEYKSKTLALSRFKLIFFLWVIILKIFSLT